MQSLVACPSSAKLQPYLPRPGQYSWLVSPPSISAPPGSLFPFKPVPNSTTENPLLPSTIGSPLHTYYQLNSGHRTNICFRRPFQPLEKIEHSVYPVRPVFPVHQAWERGWPRCDDTRPGTKDFTLKSSTTTSTMENEKSIRTLQKWTLFKPETLKC